MTGERTTRFRTHSYPTEIVSCSESHLRVLRSLCEILCTYSTRRTREGLLWCAVRCLRLWPGQEFIPRPASGISEYGNKVLLSRPPRRSRPFTNYSLNMCAFMITMKTVVSLNRCWFYKRLFTRCVLLTAYTMDYRPFERCYCNSCAVAYTSVWAIISRRFTH